jgi:hypothetical protein
MARLVIGQERSRINIDRKQIANRVLILGPGEPSKGVGAAWIRRDSSGAIEFRRKLRYDVPISRLVGSLLIEWRHLAMSQLPYNLLPNFGMRRWFFWIEPLENEIAFLRRRVVTVVTILFEKR